MLNFKFLENGLGIVPPPHSVYGFPRKMCLIFSQFTEQISLADCLYILIYWAICVVKVFVNQGVTS